MPFRTRIVEKLVLWAKRILAFQRSLTLGCFSVFERLKQGSNAEKQPKLAFRRIRMPDTKRICAVHGTHPYKKAGQHRANKRGLSDKKCARIRVGGAGCLPFPVSFGGEFVEVRPHARYGRVFASRSGFAEQPESRVDKTAGRSVAVFPKRAVYSGFRRGDAKTLPYRAEALPGREYYAATNWENGNGDEYAQIHAVPLRRFAAKSSAGRNPHCFFDRTAPPPRTRFPSERLNCAGENKMCEKDRRPASTILKRTHILSYKPKRGRVQSSTPFPSHGPKMNLAVKQLTYTCAKVPRHQHHILPAHT